eukprot:TRINITY_DN15531_c0_g1_i1.p1 TRINITY_DN15531_c0_g1~~TRINITY_DN15531_c0_g1_i1.p1  ORF type:complete len:958 (+),score=192.05 TRINITY_DN15531_c0_g1_i1:46-2919(+)
MQHQSKKSKLSDEVDHLLRLAQVQQEQATNVLSLQQQRQQLDIQLLLHQQKLEQLAAARSQLMQENLALQQQHLMMPPGEVQHLQARHSLLYASIQEEINNISAAATALSSQSRELEVKQSQLEEQLRQQQNLQLQDLHQKFQNLAPLERRRRTEAAFLGEVQGFGSADLSDVQDIVELRTLIREIPTLIQNVNNHQNIAAQIDSVSKFCRIIFLTDSIKGERRAEFKDDIVIAFEAASIARIVPLFVRFLEKEELQLQAAVALTLFCKGPRIPNVALESHLHPSQVYFKQLLIQAGVVPAMLQLLMTSPRDEVKGQCALGLGNIANHHVGCRKDVYDAGTLIPLVQLLQSSSNVDLCRAAAWAVSVLVRTEHNAFESPWKEVLEVAYTLMYRFGDEQLLLYACKTVIHLLPGPVSAQACERLYALLRHASVAVQVVACQCIQKFMEGSTEIHLFPTFGHLKPLLLQVLSSADEDARLAACRTLAAVASRPRYEIVIDLDVLRAVSSIMTRDAHVRKAAVEVIRNVTVNTPEVIKQLFNPLVVRCLCDLLPLWKLNSGNIPTFENNMVRDVLQSLDHILSWGRSAGSQNVYAAWFDDACLDMLLIFIVTLQHESGSAVQFKEEFASLVKNLLRDVEDGLDETPKSDHIRSKLRNMMHWYFRFETSEGPTLPVTTYLNHDNRTVQVARNIKLMQLIAVLEQQYQNWVNIFYLDDANQKQLMDSQEALQRAIDKFDRDGVKMLRLYLAVAPSPLQDALPSVADLAVPTAAPVKTGNAKSSTIEEVLKVSKFDAAELQRWVDHWMSNSQAGTVDRLGFRGNMANLGVQDHALADKIFQAFDTDGSGSINLREFIAGLSVMTRGTPEEKMDMAFRAYDADRSGYIDKSELRALMLAGLSAQGYSLDGELIDGMVDHCMEAIDEDGDDRVSLEEFKNAWKNPMLQQHMPYLWMSDLTALMSK